MTQSHILDLARERAEQKRRQQATVEQRDLHARRTAALALRDEFARLLGLADPSYPARLADLEVRALTDAEAAHIALTDDPQDSAFVLEQQAAKVIIRFVREHGRTNQVRWLLYPANGSPLETKYPATGIQDGAAIGQELWWHLLDALAPTDDEPGTPSSTAPF